MVQEKVRVKVRVIASIVWLTMMEMMTVGLTMYA